MDNAGSGAYDVVIIGAGIGGLICGCYLAKAGMKVLIAEQHSRPGGYCTSFRRSGYVFDAAAHSFGGYRQGGIVRKVFDDLAIEKKVTIKRFDPSDSIITPDHGISFWADIERTITEFQSAFPEEREHIRKFFYFLRDPDPKFFFHIRSWTFKKLLDHYFADKKLKSVLAYPLYGNGALPPSRMSALIGAKIFQEFLLDGGYYAGEKMQDLADALAARFNEFGGELRLSDPVKRIRVAGDKVEGVVSGSTGFVQSKYIVSNGDARQTFTKLLAKSTITEEFSNSLKAMVPSLSIFILYLGLNKTFKRYLSPGVNFWLLSNYDLEKTYVSQQKIDLNNACKMVRAMPNQESLLAFANVPYKSKLYWEAHRDTLRETFIGKIDRLLVNGLVKNIVYKGTATPHTLQRYTRNYKGAAYGWECTPAQVGLREFRKPTFIKGLYMAGHWTTQGLGIPGVIYSGLDTAKSILRNARYS